MPYPIIRKEMSRCNVTVREVADSLGLPVQCITFKLEGTCEFTLSEIERMADLLGCSLDYLVGHKVKVLK